MKIHTLKRKQLIPYDRETVFNFFKSPENLEKITPPKVKFNIITPSPIIMRSGTILDYTIKLLGIPVRWTTMITEFNEPIGFSDVSLKGPYSFWYHQHTFEKTTGGTVMHDTVTYALPFGVIGSAVHALWVKNQLKHIFDFRAEVISALFENIDNANRISQDTK